MPLSKIPTGTYVLLLHLPDNQTITVGKLGTFDFPAGWYTYIGSAFGAGGLLGRIKHHLQPPDKPHWHIDYLRRHAVVTEIWLSPDTERREAEWVDLMVDIPGAVALIEGFGASDSNKDTHLFYFDLKPSLEDFAVGVHNHFPGAQVLRAFGGS
ncbi:MAG: GIY-YIG nuclease family protein [Chloroflexi bacterium]|nr:MAG: GIY-YIG nuclease family protein [Chloroflexota bacterium]